MAIRGTPAMPPCQPRARQATEADKDHGGAWPRSDYWHACSRPPEPWRDRLPGSPGQTPSDRPRVWSDLDHAISETSGGTVRLAGPIAPTSRRDRADACPTATTGSSPRTRSVLQASCQYQARLDGLSSRE